MAFLDSLSALCHRSRRLICSVAPHRAEILFDASKGSVSNDLARRSSVGSGRMHDAHEFYKSGIELHGGSCSSILMLRSPKCEQSKRKGLNAGGGRQLPEDSEPEEPPSIRAYMLGMGGLTLLTLPVRHFVWSILLQLYGLRHPDIWDSEFPEGSEKAYRFVFERLSAGDLPSLKGLASQELLSRFEVESKGTSDQGWEVPPQIESAGMLAIMWAQILGGGEEAELRIDIAMTCKERYQYSGGGAPLVLWRLQRCALQRPLSGGGRWRFVKLGAKPWYWDRPFRKET